MKLNQIACQLYTVREHLQTPGDIAASLKKVRAIGYEAVELGGLGSIPAAEIAQVLNGEGLTCCATHESGKALFSDPQSVIERCRLFRCGIAVFPWPGAEPPFDTLADVREFAKYLNTAGRILHDAGITFCYHNHHMEFRRVDRRLVFEVLLDETDPRHVKVELDTHWVQFGGGNPGEWCRKLHERLAILHMKDYGIDTTNGVVFEEVGNGNLDWPDIIASAQDAGCQWFVVEQDRCPGDPFESLQKSYKYIRRMFCES
jgi:sugar phosphate isomerase/epimerase